MIIGYAKYASHIHLYYSRIPRRYKTSCVKHVPSCLPQAPRAPSATPFIAPGYEAVYFTLHGYYVGTTYPQKTLFYNV